MQETANGSENREGKEGDFNKAKKLTGFDLEKYTEGLKAAEQQLLEILV